MRRLLERKRSTHSRGRRTGPGIILSTALLYPHVSPLYAAELTATLNIASDYVFRGISLTDGPAVQASLDYAFDKGIYIGTWTSNYDFDTASKRELDFYIGYSRSLQDSVALSAHAARYTFLDEHEIDYNEFNIGFTYFRFDAKVWHAIDYGGSDGNAQYYEIGYKFELPRLIVIEIRAGHSVFAAQTGSKDYSDLIASIKKTFNGFDGELRLTDTNESQYGSREELNLIAAISTTFR